MAVYDLGSGTFDSWRLILFLLGVYLANSRITANLTARSHQLTGVVAGVCADLLLLDQRNGVGVVNGGRGGVGNVGR